VTMYTPEQVQVQLAEISERERLADKARRLTDTYHRAAVRRLAAAGRDAIIGDLRDAARVSADEARDHANAAGMSVLDLRLAGAEPEVVAAAQLAANRASEHAGAADRVAESLLRLHARCRAVVAS
jgi:hypothetical protein